MYIQQHGAYLIELTKFPGILPVSCYLVREEDGFTLIDTGISGMQAAILDAAQQRGVPIVRIALTHVHSDHVGSLDALHGLLPGAEALVGARESRFLARDFSLDPGEPQAKLRGGFSKLTTRPTRLLDEGERVGSLQVVASPGHTPGHIAFFDTRDGSLIAGDAFMIQGGIAVSGTLRWRYPLGPFVTWHLPTALASARRLRALNPTRLAVGHGPVLEAPGAAMDEAIRTAERQLARTDGGQRVA
jgi:glyoxylase-like metal-dependent hydrolase (beta-lactamase superfamily II)